MRLIRVEQLPKRYERDFASEAFTEHDVKNIEATGADLAAYWYGAGCYEGSGQLIFRVDGKWYLHDCGHCSCYWPVDERLSVAASFGSLDALLASCSSDRRTDVEPVAAALREYGVE